MADILRITQAGNQLVLHMSDNKRVFAYPTSTGWVVRGNKPVVKPQPPVVVPPPAPNPEPGTTPTVPPSPGKWRWPFQYSRFVLPDPRAQFGMRINPVTGLRRNHNGLDFGGGGIKGLEIKAAADGVVILAQYNGGEGNAVHIQHDNNVVTKYFHARDTPIVKVGDKVSMGQTLSYVGTTGQSTGAHLHWETHINNTTPVNPRDFMRQMGVPET